MKCHEKRNNSLLCNIFCPMVIYLFCLQDKTEEQIIVAQFLSNSSFALYALIRNVNLCMTSLSLHEQRKAIF